MLSRLRPFKYLEPSTLSEALSSLDQYEGKAKILAGGTDLIIQMKQRKVAPEYVINIKKIPGLNYIKYDEVDLRIGALVTHTSLTNSPIIREKFGLLADAALAVGLVQTRNRGTVGGNLCNASPSADTPPALMALGAKLRIVSTDGEKVIRIEDFFKGPFTTVLKPEELLLEIQITDLPPHWGGAYLWVPKVTAVDETLVGVAVFITIDLASRVCMEVRIGLCSVGATPIRAYRTEEFLKGKKIEEKLFWEAGEIASQEALPRSREEYRREMIRVFIKRAMDQAYGKLINRFDH